MDEPEFDRTRHAGEAAPDLVRLSGVGKVYRTGTEALRGVDLQVKPGEFISILGPSGCGKSTLLRLIAGLGAASSGEIEWPDRADTAKAHSIGFVFQEPTLMPWASVFDNVFLPLRLSGMARREASPRVLEILARVGLEAFAKAYPRELSGGMKMRVAIARALVVRPRLLLMDEPFAALDEITRHRLEDDLLELWREQHWTVLFVTHSVFESVYLSTRVVVMKARPGSIAVELPIAAPHSRNPEFRTSPDYAGWCRRVSGELAGAMAVPAVA